MLRASILLFFCYCAAAVNQESEPGVPPLAPAVANAVAKLGGPRVRRLPFTRAGLVAT